MSSPIKIYSQFDVVVVPFPFTLDYSLIVRQISHLGKSDADAVMQSIEKLFNFTLE